MGQVKVSSVSRLLISGIFFRHHNYFQYQEVHGCEKSLRPYFEIALATGATVFKIDENNQNQFFFNQWQWNGAYF